LTAMSARLRQSSLKYQPSWKFSMLPQKAQKLDKAVDRITAVHPMILRAIEWGGIAR